MLADVFSEIVSFISTNHFLAVFYICVTVSFFILVFRNEKNSETLAGLKRALSPAAGLIIYSVIAVLLLVLPVTALVLRKFQTVFFSYNTLWVMVPVIPLSAFALTVFSGLLRKTKKSIGVFALILSIFLLLSCGSLGNTGLKVKGTELPGLKEKEITFYEAMPVLKRLSDLPNDALILATPAITEYIRQYTGKIKTVYGRDIWDLSLASYNYNSYDEISKKLYEWMLYSDSYGCIYYQGGSNVINDFDYSVLDHAALDEDSSYLGGVKAAKLAEEKNVSVICFSVNEKTDRAGLEHLKTALSAESEYIEIDSDYDMGYYLLFL